MPAQLPSYYTRLKPFAALFAAGKPCLMYHKLGPRPRGVRLKGLYVSAALFDRQLRELRAAGFTGIAPGELTAHPDNRAKQICLTFDDGFVNVLKFGLEVLSRHGFRAIEYLVADRLGGTNDWEQREGEASEPLMDGAQIKEWLAAGHDIGAHTLTHPRLSQVTLAQAREEIFASKKKLEDLFGRPVRHFCYPYGDWNPAIRDLVIAAGYETATTTAIGVNTAATPRFELKRFMARHQSLSFKALKERFARAAG